MKNVLSLLLILAGSFLVACNGGNKTASEEAGQTPEPPPAPATLASGCYQATIGPDTAFMEIDVNGALVAGMLEIRPLEKDRSLGTFSGTIEGDRIVAEYEFMSEGMESVREIAFLIRDGKLLDGYGDMEERDGAMRFSDRSQLKFDESYVYGPVECPEE